MPFRFLDFKVYRDAKAFYQKILNTITYFPREEQFNLADQLRRASLSILLNIAEGCDKGTDKDFNRYLMNALGSLNEVVAGLDIATGNGYLDREVFQSLMKDAESLSKQLGGFSKKLKS